MTGASELESNGAANAADTNDGDTQSVGFI
jgi:hypothetical protein